MYVYLGTANGDMNGNFFISTNAECSDGISSLKVNLSTPKERTMRADLAVDGRLAAELFQDFGCSGQSVARLADGNVEHEFFNLDVPHGVFRGFCVGVLGLQDH